MHGDVFALLHGRIMNKCSMRPKFHRSECMKLVKNRSNRHILSNSSRGFSLIELLVAMVVALILAAIAIPSIVNTYSQYRLGVQATLIANQLDLLRMNAVRSNTTITLFRSTTGCGTSGTVIYIDINKDNACDSKDPQMMLPPDMQISNDGGAAPTGMPGTASMVTPYTTTLALAS